MAIEMRALVTFSTGADCMKGGEILGFSFIVDQSYD